MNKKVIILIISILLVGVGIIYFLYANLFPDQNVEFKAYSTLAEYYASINYSCDMDSDCEKKDVSGCCGYYPRCTNSNAAVDPIFVKSACERDAPAMSCKYPPINACKCENKKCQGYSR